MTDQDLANYMKVPLKEVIAMKKHLARKDVQRELKAFREFELSPQSRTMAYSGCLNLMRDPPKGVWADGSTSPKRKMK